MDIFYSFLLGAIAATIAFIALRTYLKRFETTREVSVDTAMRTFQNINELNVFKLRSKEIVSVKENSLGQIGQKYLKWLVTDKKLSLIFVFDVNFKYNLHHDTFTIELPNEEQCNICMPPIDFDIAITDIEFYDEQSSKFLPILLPDILSKSFTQGFDEASKNRLISEAKQEVRRMVEAMIDDLRPEIEKSAQQTLSYIARSFGAQRINVIFNENQMKRVA